MIAKTSPTHGGPNWLASSRKSGATVPAIAISDPTERSIPPVAMTKVMPTPTMMIVAACVRLALNVFSVRKFVVKKTL